MFGQKSRRIEELKTRLRDTENCYDKVRAARDKLETELAHAKKDVEMLTDRYVELSDELDQALESVSGYESQVAELELARNQQNTINQALADENRDLSARYTLLEQVLKQLQIPVKLGRKK